MGCSKWDGEPSNDKLYLLWKVYKLNFLHLEWEQVGFIFSTFVVMVEESNWFDQLIQLERKNEETISNMNTELNALEPKWY